jgi:hypothetical protein
MVGCDFSRAVPEVVYVLDRDHFGQHGVWIVLGVMRGADFHPSELLVRGGILAAGWAGMGDWLGEKRSEDVDNCPFSSKNTDSGIGLKG